MRMTAALGRQMLLLAMVCGAMAASRFEQGKVLYNAAGSCVACHMPNGVGIEQSVPPLKGSLWLDNPQRTIAIALRGLEGPMLVNGQPYDSMMPPQALFNDEQLALIITYINGAWGNDYPAVTTAQVAKARKNLPQEVYNPKSILKAFPFKNKKVAKKNRPYEPDFDDKLDVITTPVVYRTFMPGASPAAFAVALPGNQYYCWDAGECRLRYVWTEGGFIRGNKRHWSSNGKPVAQFRGVPYYQARSSLTGLKTIKELAGTGHGAPIYDTTQVKDFPIAIAGLDNVMPSYEGYRLIDEFPEFHYTLGGYAIYERITATEDQLGILRHFRIEAGDQAVTLRLAQDPKAMIEVSAGVLAADGTLRLGAAEAQSFTVAIRETARVQGGTP